MFSSKIVGAGGLVHSRKGAFASTGVQNYTGFEVV